MSSKGMTVSRNFVTTWKIPAETNDNKALYHVGQ